MKKVSDMLARKGAHVMTVSPDTTVIDALKIMSTENMGSVVVTQDNNFLGIMTERDYSRKVALKGRSSTDTTVADIMSTEFPKVTPKDTVDFCMQLMSEKNIRYLPVFNEGRLSGIISINDVVKETILAHEETISHLTDYLHAGM